MATVEIVLDLRSHGEPVTGRGDAMLLVLLVFVGATARLELTSVPDVPGRWLVGFPQQYAPAENSRPVHLRFGVCEIKEAQR